MNIMNSIENDLLDMNQRFSLSEYQKLKPTQQLSFKNQLKDAIAALKRNYSVAMMDDEYLFTVAETKANYTIMQLMNELKELTFRKKTSAIQGNPAQQADMVRKQQEIKVQLAKTLFGAHALFNKIDSKTIAIDQTMLKKIIG
jgi:hypothetical protein